MDSTMRVEREAPFNRGVDQARLVRRSAQILMFFAGVLTIMNAASSLHGVDTAALRITGVVTVVASLCLGVLPWQSHVRVVSYAVVIVSIGALVASDSWHHYSRDAGAIAVYPMFFILVIAWAGLTQPRFTPTLVACLSGVALAWLLHDNNSTAAAQCVLVTVPVAAVLGEVISWVYRRALSLGELDTRRRAALEALVDGANQLQDALTQGEREAALIEIANNTFSGTNTRYTHAPAIVDDGPSPLDISYIPERRELVVQLRGQSGVVGTVTTEVDPPDAFMVDAARLYSQHIGARYEQLRLIDALTDAATLDPLTGVGNRRAAQTGLDNLAPGDVVFMLDLDKFKDINDSLGHQAGDRLLSDLGEYLRSRTRKTDTVIRYGGEEFLLICPQCAPADAQLLANHLLDGWRDQRPLTTFSIGWAIHGEGAVAQRTIELADMALYDAKRNGRDCARPQVAANSNDVAV